MRKLKSRKFWISVAAFLASIATSITGAQIGNDVVTSVGLLCSMLSAGIYAAAEAYCDANCNKEE